ncbi:hypothetical protein, partial [Vagococcus fluvialis]
KVNEISENFKGKFKIVTDLSNDFKVAFSNPKSVFDLKITFEGKEYSLLPAFMMGAMETVRSVLSGALVLFTFTDIYKRIVGSGDVIKS